MSSEFFLNENNQLQIHIEDCQMKSGSTFSESPLSLLKAMAFGAHAVGIIFRVFVFHWFIHRIVSIDNTILGSV